MELVRRLLFPSTAPVVVEEPPHQVACAGFDLLLLILAKVSKSEVAETPLGSQRYAGECRRLAELDLLRPEFRMLR